MKLDQCLSTDESLLLDHDAGYRLPELAQKARPLAHVIDISGAPADPRTLDHDP